YGRTLADGALLILLACFGLAERGHETTPALAQFFCISMLVYGLVRLLDKPIQGTLIWSAGLGFAMLTGRPVLVGALMIGTLGMMRVVREARTRWLLLAGLPVALVLSVSWPIAALVFFPSDAVWFLNQWVRGSLHSFTGPFGPVLLYALKNLPLFTWP